MQLSKDLCRFVARKSLDLTSDDGIGRNEKAGAELPHSKTDKYLDRILLGLIRAVKEKDGSHRVSAATNDEKYRETKSRSPDPVGINSARPLQFLAGGAFRLGGLGLADFGGADFVSGGVAGALEGTPQIPTGDGAVRAPAFTEGKELFGFGHVFFAVGDRPALFDA